MNDDPLQQHFASSIRRERRRLRRAMRIISGPRAWGWRMAPQASLHQASQGLTFRNENLVREPALAGSLADEEEHHPDY